MSMLAERKRKTKWVNPGRQALWKQDVGGMKFGRELMEKMGWKIGQGLGVNNQGITEPLKVSLKNDNKGMGYKGSDNEWIQQQSEFDSLLNQLSSSEPFQGKETLQDSKKDSVRSLEERSKLSKARLQYNKFTRGKDFTKYSEKDIECIIGCKKKDFSPFVLNQEDDINCKSHMEESGLITINSGSMMDYFAKKMQSKTDSNTCLLTKEKNLVKENEDAQEKELKKKKKKKRKISEESSKEYHEEPYCDELVLKDLNCHKIKSFVDEKYHGIKMEDNPKYSSERNFHQDPAMGKNSKDKSKEQEKELLLHLKVDTSNEGLKEKEKEKEKKKKKKKSKCNEEFPKDMEAEALDDNKNTNESNEGRSEGTELFDLYAKENCALLDADKEPDFANRKKKKKEKKRSREMETTVEEEEEEEKVEKKKKKKVKKKEVNLDDVNVISDTESEITRNQKGECMEKSKPSPSSGSLLYKTELLKTSDSLKNNQQNKILNLIYCMNTEKFNGSNLALLNGYGIIRCKTES